MVSAASRWSAAEHEAGFVWFVEPRFRHRFRTLLPARRDEIPREFAGWMDPRFSWRAGRAHGGARLLGILQGKGAPKTCYLLSDDEDLNGRELPLDEVLTTAVSGSPVYVYLASCVPGRLGFFVDAEWYEKRWILERRERP